MDEKEEVIENEAIKVLEHAEAVLQKRINVMKAGGPMSAAVIRLKDIKDALKLLKANQK